MRITTINLDNKTYDYIKSKSNNVSKYINKILKEKMDNDEERIIKLKDEIKEKELEIKRLEEKKNLEKKKREEQIKTLTSGQKEELIKSIEIINKIGGNSYVEGRYNRYKNLFGELTKEEFMELIKLFNKNN